MRIFNFPMKPIIHGRPIPETMSFQPIDLDYIVSIGPILPVSYSGSNIGESHAYFYVYIKIGVPIPIYHFSGSTEKCPPELVNSLERERQKLIKAWTEGQE